MPESLLISLYVGFGGGKLVSGSRLPQNPGEFSCFKSTTLNEEAGGEEMWQRRQKEEDEGERAILFLGHFALS